MNPTSRQRRLNDRRIYSNAIQLSRRCFNEPYLSAVAVTIHWVYYNAHQSDKRRFNGRFLSAIAATISCGHYNISPRFCGSRFCIFSLFLFILPAVFLYESEGGSGRSVSPEKPELRTAWRTCRLSPAILRGFPTLLSLRPPPRLSLSLIHI